jgi:hypothetical protein
MCAEILRPDRQYPIVGLTCRAGTRDSALSFERVRERIWPTAPIYVIEPRESRTDNNLLPHRLGAYNGAARVWWPGVDDDSEPSWHPLIYDSTGIYGEDALERLAAEFALESRASIDPSPREQAALRLRSVPRPAALPPSSNGREPALVLLLASRKDLRRLTTNLRRGDRDYPIVVHAAGLDNAELELVARMAPEALMHRLICREWAGTLQPADFRKHPLGNYVLGPHFIRSIEDKRIATPRAPIAFARAMVSCRMAKTHSGLEPHSLRDGDKSGDDPQAVRADGAKGMVCNLGHGMGAARLIYWVLPDGKTEFEAVRNHDAIGRA